MDPVDVTVRIGGYLDLDTRPSHILSHSAYHCPGDAQKPAHREDITDGLQERLDVLMPASAVVFVLLNRYPRLMNASQ